MVAYIEEKIKLRNEICKAIDNDKDSNKSRLNEILMEAAKAEKETGTIIRPKSIILRKKSHF